MKTIKILHIGSFIGNIGDNISNMGLYNIINSLLANFEVTQIEIRKFYDNYCANDKMYFDSAFVAYINTFDVCIIGGGGFLTYNIDNSPSGCTIALTPHLLKQIKIPLILSSLGCNNDGIYGQSNVKDKEKFKNFMTACINQDNVYVAIRNDGSLRKLGNDFGFDSNSFQEALVEVLDNGFFYKMTDSPPPPYLLNQDYIAINLPQDQIRPVRKDTFIKEILTISTYFINHGYHIMFVPHIFIDLKLISEILDSMSNFTARKYIRVAPMIQGNVGANYLCAIYKYAKLSIVSRLHANIANIAIRQPAIGLNVRNDRILHLYESIHSRNCCINIEEGFSKKVIAQCLSCKIDYDIIDSLMTETIGIYRAIFDKYGFSKSKHL